MSTYEVVATVTSVYLVVTALLAVCLIAKGSLEELGRRADLAIDNFVMRVGPEGWGSIVVFPIVTNVGSAMLVAGSVTVANAIRNGDFSFWLGYGTAIAGLVVAIGVPVWASREFKNPERVGVSVLLYGLSKEVNESTRRAALAAIEREESTALARMANTHGIAFKVYLSLFAVGTLWACALLLMAGDLAGWAIIGIYLTLVTIALLVRGPVRKRGLKRVVDTLALYRNRAMNARSRTSESSVRHQRRGTGSASIFTALVAGAVLSRLIGRRQVSR